MERLNKTGQCNDHVKKIVLQDLLNFSDSSDDELTSSLQLPSKKKNQIQTMKLDNDRTALTCDGEKENAVDELKPQKKVCEKVEAEVFSETKKTAGKCKSGSAAVKGHMIWSGSLHAEKKKTGTKKRTVHTASKQKKNTGVLNMTLADHGISADFSESSDEGEDKPRKGRIELLYRGEKDNLKRNTEQLRNDSRQPHSNPSVVKDPTKAGIKDQGAGDNCKPCQMPADPVSGKAAPPAADLVGLAQNTGMEKTVSDSKKLITKKASVTEPQSKPLVQKSIEKAESSHTSKHEVHLQHPCLSVIRSARLSSSLFAGPSPSEESLVPLSESTRLDCAESDVSSKQNSAHLLAFQNSPQLFDSSLRQSQDSSYEQLHIVQKKAPTKETDDVSASDENKKRDSFMEEKQAVSCAETSETDSTYVTCLATPDVSSMYEAVDVSVQTSFNIAIANLTGVGKDSEVSVSLLQSPADGDRSKDPDHHVECIHKSDQMSHEESENGITAQEREVCLKEKLQAHTPSEPTSLLCQNVIIRDESDRKDNDIETVDDELPDLISGSNDKVRTGTMDKQHKGRGSALLSLHKSAEKFPVPPSPLHQLQRMKLPSFASDSNYYSESRSDVDNAHDSEHLHQRSNLEVSHHKVAGSSKEDSDLRKKDKSAFIADECAGPEIEENALQCRNSPEAACSDGSKSGEGQTKGNSVFRQRGEKPGLDNSSSEDDSDDKLQAFFQKLQTPAKPTSATVEKDGDMDDFIVNDSDVTDSDEEICDSDLAWSPDADVFSQSTGTSKQARTRKGLTHHASNKSPSSSEVEDDESSTDDCDSDDDIVSELATPHRPTFSHSQTPREASPKWYTPATSIKTKPKRALSRDDSNASATSRTQDKTADSSCAFVTPATLPRNRNNARPFAFLRSLSMDTPDHLRDTEARSYIVHFKKKQEELSSRLFKLFNFTVFENQLPADLQLVWNKRLLKTAGRCKQKRVGRVYTAAIELSTKVCDTAERVRDTLVHEMCHAAVWIINKAKERHGPHWRYWAAKANRAHPEIPIIRRCHDYNISTKYIYKCVQCGYQVGRHSKSLDTDRKVCGRCRGRFQLLASRNSSSASLSATPRTPNPFAMFVKENYGSVKKQGGGLAHKEVMETLSKGFAKAKITFN